MEENSLANNPGYFVGDKLRSWFGAGQPMGSWTGLPPLLGGPVSGALWGAGLGALAGGVRELTAPEPDPLEPPRPPGFWKSRVGRGLLLGALGGGAVGVGSGVLQTEGAAAQARQNNLNDLQGFDTHLKKQSSKQANDRSEVERAIRNNYQMSPDEKARILRALTGADYLQLQRLAAVAAAGGLTALAASKILGLGALGASLVGGFGALLANNYFRPPDIWV